MYTKAVRQTRARRKAAFARDETLKAKIESWAVVPLRNIMHAKEEAMTERFQAKTSSVGEEYKKILDRICAMENKQRDTVKEEVSAAISLRRKDIESKFSSHSSSIECSVRQQAAEMEEALHKFRVEQDRLKQEWNDFFGTAARRLEHIETTIRDYRENTKTLHTLKAELTRFASSEDERDVINRRLAALVKDLEERNWPWRPRMDRSPSPSSSEIKRSNNDREMDFTGSPDGEWKFWPVRGPVRAQAGGSAKPTPPSSRPTSARFRRPSGSAMEAKTPVVRPSSAREKGKHDRPHSTS